MSLGENWVLRVSSSVFKDLKSFPRKDGERVYFAIQNLAFDPFSGDIQKQKGEEDVWRRRIGNYRIFYEFLKNENVVYVFRVERRTTKIYKKK